MPAPQFAPEQGPFLSFLDWLDRPGQVVRNLLTGRPGAAGRQFLDFLGEIPDAILPGDVIPDATTPDDNVAPHELVGMDENTPWYLRVPTDIGLGIATDPLSFIGVGEAANAVRAGLKVGVPFTKAAHTFDVGADLDPLRNVGRAYNAIVPDQAKQIMAPAWMKLRSTFGAEQLTPETEALRQAAQTAGTNVNRAGQDAVRDLFQGTTPEDRQAMFRAVRNVTQDPNGEWRELLAESDPRNPLYDIAKQSDELAPNVPGSIPTAEDALLKVKDERTVTPPLTPEDEAVGLGGVAQYPIHPFMTAPGPAPRPLAQWADEAADATRAQAYPPELDPARFASGIDVANRALGTNIGPDRISTFLGETPLAGVPDLGLPKGGDISRLAVKAAENADGWKETVATGVDQLTGAPVAKSVAPPTIELPDMGARLNEMLGGPKASLERMSVTEAPELTQKFDYAENQLNRWNARVDAMGLPPEQADRVKQLLGRYLDLTHTQYKEATQDMRAFYKPPGIDVERELPADYAMGIYELPEGEKAMAADLGVRNGMPDTLKGKVLRRGADLANWLNETGATPEQDLAVLAAKRAEQQGRLATKASAGSGLLDQTIATAKTKLKAGEELTDAEKQALEAEGKTLAQPEFQTAVRSIIQDAAAKSPEDGQVLSDLFNGMAPRGKIMSALATLNRYFKPYAVYGLALPKLGSIVRNRIAAPFMGAATPGAEAALARQASPVQIVKEVTAAVMDGLGMADRAPGAVFDDVRTIDKAFKGAGGRASNVAATLRAKGREDLALAVEHGVLDSFVRSEKLIGDVKRQGWKGWLQKVMESPGVMFQATEHQMRLGMFQDLLKAGKSPEEAAKLTSSALYDYGTNSTANRAFRDLIPFGQFQSKAVQQQGQWLARNPAVGVAASQVFGVDPDRPVPDWVAGQASIPFGRDEQGNPQYITGLGLPIESLAKVPGLNADDIRRDVIASSQPLLKTGFGWLAGEDPYFGTPFGSYDKLPIVGGHSRVGAAYQTLTEAGGNPLAPALGSIDKLLDDRRSMPARALDFLTGANVVSVDEAQAEQEMLQRILENDPSIRHYDSLYTQSQDPDTRALVQQYNQLRADVKKRRAAELAASVD